MKKKQLNLAHKYFRYLRKYRNLHLRIREMLKTGVYQTLNVHVQKALQRKLDIYYRRLSTNRLLRAGKVAMLTASFAMLTQVMQAQVDTIWAKMPAENNPFQEIWIDPQRNLVVDANNDGLVDILSKSAAYFQTSDANNRFIEDKEWMTDRASLRNKMYNAKYCWTDFDQDGDVDALYIDSYNAANIRLYENTGDFSFTEKTEASNPFDGFSGMSKMALIDVDADGDLDLIGHERYYHPAAHQNYFYKVFYENTSGDESFTFDAVQKNPAIMSNISNPFNSTFKMMSAIDVNGDGDNDLMVMQSNGNINIFDINASGNFEQFIDETTEPHEPLFIDVDGDLDLDLVRCGDYRGVTNINNDTRFNLEYENEFITPGPLYTKYSELPHQLVDVDNDGDLDLMMSEYKYSSDPYFSGNVLKVYKNTGDAQNPEFSLQDVWADHHFGNIDLTNTGNITSGHLLNLDADADLELLILYQNQDLKFFDYDNSLGTVSEADAIGGVFDTPTENGVIDGSPVSVVDFDMDGDNDIFYGFYSDDDGNNKRIYIENTGTASEPEWTTRVGANNPLNSITIDATNNALHFVDFNKDGKMDFFISGNSFSTYEKNTSDATAYSFATTSANTNYGYSSSNGRNFKHMADLNGNGKPELYTANDYYKAGYTFEYLPKFELPNATFTINENSPGETVVGNLQTTENIEIDIRDFVIASGNDLGLFELVGTTNELRLKADAVLDYESVQEVVLKVNLEAFQESKKKSSHPGYNSEGNTTSDITVKVNNQNDNAPVIDAVANNLSINENSAVGAEIVTITATDADGDLNPLVFSTTETKVAIDASSGVVTIVDSAYFDAETNTNISFNVKVSDGTYEDTETVNITINNINDNTPVLAALADDLNVSENSTVGTELLTLSATDADGSLNTLSYSTSNTKVAVNASTGKVTIADSAYFNFEAVESISFDVKVNDGTNEDTETVTITINNVNDNTPTINPLISNIPIDENRAVGAVLMKIEASDTDGDLNALSFSTDESEIAIDATTGRITVVDSAFFDAEVNDSVVFVVGVSDGANSSTYDISIVIKNLNDNAPIINDLGTDLSVDENSKVGTELLTLTAIDADGDAFTFSTSNEKVAIDANTGLVTIVDSAYFDAETNASLNFDAKVSDGTNESIKNVTIIINDVNENELLKFNAISDNLNINENSNVGTKLLTLSATDANTTTSTLSYSTDSKIVSVDASTGIVSIVDSAAFDAEVNAIVSFDVKVSNGISTDAARININVNNVNDNAPAFAAIASNLNIDENSAVGTTLLTLSASDADGDSFSFSTTDTIIAIDAAGKVNIANAVYFDAESNKSLSFNVKVSDGTFEDTETVSIAINNVNDNAPVFAPIASDLNIDENSTVGTELLTLLATDADGDAFTFSSSDTLVTVNAATGAVSIADSAYFDYEVNTSITFKVVVSDGTNSSEETVTIAINDINEQVENSAPVFAAIADNLSVNENSAVGTELLTLSATDGDGDALTFSTNDNKIAVNASTGVVTIADSAYFDAETVTSLSFDVYVTDGTDADTATVSIAISNINDNAPVFAQENYSVALVDTDIDESAILTLSASDADNLGELSYALSDGFSVFALSEAGELTIENADNITTETDKATYTIAATVSDGELSDEAEIMVEIDITTGMVEVMQKMQVKVYPNPAQSKVSIEIPEFSNGTMLEMHTVNGNVVRNMEISSAKSTVEISDLQQGVYFIRVKSGNKVAIQKLVKE